MWAWFVSTRFGRWVIGIAALVAAFVAAWWLAHVQGASAQAIKDAKAQQESDAADARAAQQVTLGAAAAADQVRQDAAHQPPPDTAGRNDLDNTGFPQ